MLNSGWLQQQTSHTCERATVHHDLHLSTPQRGPSCNQDDACGPVLRRITSRDTHSPWTSQ